MGCSSGACGIVQPTTAFAPAGCTDGGRKAFGGRNSAARKVVAIATPAVDQEVSPPVGRALPPPPHKDPERKGDSLPSWIPQTPNDRGVPLSTMKAAPQLPSGPTADGTPVGARVLLPAKQPPFRPEVTSVVVPVKQQEPSILPPVAVFVPTAEKSVFSPSIVTLATSTPVAAVKVPAAPAVFTASIPSTATMSTAPDTVTGKTPPSKDGDTSIDSVGHPAGAPWMRPGVSVAPRGIKPMLNGMGQPIGGAFDQMQLAGNTGPGTPWPQILPSGAPMAPPAIAARTAFYDACFSRWLALPPGAAQQVVIAFARAVQRNGHYVEANLAWGRYKSPEVVFNWLRALGPELTWAFCAMVANPPYGIAKYAPAGTNTVEQQAAIDAHARAATAAATAASQAAALRAEARQDARDAAAAARAEAAEVRAAQAAQAERDAAARAALLGAVVSSFNTIGTTTVGLVQANQAYLNQQRQIAAAAAAAATAADLDRLRIQTAADLDRLRIEHGQDPAAAAQILAAQQAAAVAAANAQQAQFALATAQQQLTATQASSMTTGTVAMIGLGVAALAGVGYVMYNRSKHPRQNPRGDRLNPFCSGRASCRCRDHKGA